MQFPIGYKMDVIESGHFCPGTISGLVYNRDGISWARHTVVTMCAKSSHGQSGFLKIVRSFFLRSASPMLKAIRPIFGIEGKSGEELQE